MMLVNSRENSFTSFNFISSSISYNLPHPFVVIDYSIFWTIWNLSNIAAVYDSVTKYPGHWPNCTILFPTALLTDFPLSLYSAEA